MRLLKWLAWLVGGIVALLVVGIAAIALLFNPNDHKPAIEQLITEQTGRSFKLNGDLQLSFFPWLAVQTGAASLGNAPGFGDTPMVSIQGARLGIRLWPLLKGQFEIGDVELDTPRILLIATAEDNNWSDLGGDATPDATEKPADASSEPLKASIASLTIKQGAISYEDRAGATTTMISDFNLSTGTLTPGKPVDLSTSFALQRGDLQLKAQLTSNITSTADNSRISLNKPTITLTMLGDGYPKDGQAIQLVAASMIAELNSSQYTIEQPSITATMQGDSYPKNGLPLSINAKQITASTETQLAEIQALVMDVAGAKLSAELKAQQIVDAPRITGNLQLAQLSPRELASKLGVELPVTADANTLKQLSFSASLDATDNSVSLKPITLKLDNTTINGSFAIADLERMAMRFDLSADSLNADRYLEPLPDTPAATSASTEPTPIAVDWLNDLDVAGTLKFKALTVHQLPFTELLVSMVAAKQQLQLAPVSATLYEGKYQGNITLNAQQATPRLAIDQQMQGINFAPLFKTLFDTQRVAGKGNLTMKLTASGADSAALKRNLNGTLPLM